MLLYGSSLSRRVPLYVRTVTLSLLFLYIVRNTREAIKIRFRARQVRTYVYRRCENAYVREWLHYTGEERVSRRVAGSSTARASGQIISQLADHVYIPCLICKHSQPLVGQIQNVTYVDVKRLDECLQIERLSHYAKATVTHLHILETVSKFTTYGSVAILEEDTVNLYDSTKDVGPFPVTSLIDSLRKERWKILRLGYKPFFLRDNTKFRNMFPLFKACPEQCKCFKFHDKACLMPHGGCDMRSSDAYIIKRSAISDLVQAISEGNVVDVHAMRSITPQSFLVPQLNFQNGQSIEDDKQLAERFHKLCTN